MINYAMWERLRQSKSNFLKVARSGMQWSGLPVLLVLQIWFSANHYFGSAINARYARVNIGMLRGSNGGSHWVDRPGLDMNFATLRKG